MFAVPVVPPSVNDVAAPPIFNVVAVLLKMFALDCVVVILPPFTAMLPPTVVLPFDPSTEKFVPVMSFAPSAIAVTIEASETSSAVVMPPPPVDEIVKPVGRI